MKDLHFFINLTAVFNVHAHVFDRIYVHPDVKVPKLDFCLKQRDFLFQTVSFHSKLKLNYLGLIGF